MNIKTQLIPKGTKRRSGIKLNKVVFFVDHDTGNPETTAQNNATYYTNSANEREASAHAFVDDLGIIVVVPCTEPSTTEKAWHVMYGLDADNKKMGDDANDVAIGVELCYFPSDKARSFKAYNNYVEFAAYLAYIHKVDPSKRMGHYEIDPARRSDPNNALAYIGKTYDNMKKDIIAKYKEVYMKPRYETLIERASSDSAELWKQQIANIIKDGEEKKAITKYLGTLLEKIYNLDR